MASCITGYRNRWIDPMYFECQLVCRDQPTVGLTSRSGVIPVTPRQDSQVEKVTKYIPKGGHLKCLKRDGLRGKRLGLMRLYPDFAFNNDTESFNKFEKPPY
ncbi:Amidase [Artemisia annua]|uniref:Amidase n=1 Tax=Artemisia annua TaxID=35608 RepID=A0A2U1LLA4_ARTAN|nr:Amidase [Artemisia annua]